MASKQIDTISADVSIGVRAPSDLALTFLPEKKLHNARSNARVLKSEYRRN